MISTACCYIQPKASYRRLATYYVVIILVLLSTSSRGEQSKKCPDFNGINGCLCYNFEDGLFLECPSATIQSLKEVLEAVDKNVHSLAVQKLDHHVTTLSRAWLPPATCVKHVHMSQTKLEDIDDDTFLSLKICIETLSIDSSNLSHVPQKAFSGLEKLISLSLESNAIKEILDYSFYGLPLLKLNIKANRLEVIAEYAFSSLEKSLSELDLSENNLKSFPFNALHKLKHLRSLRFAWNELDSIPFYKTTGLNALVFLDLSANNILSITEDCFHSFPSIRTLSLDFNNIEIVNKRSFRNLKKLENLNISHNRIINLDRNLFQDNKELQSIDLSHNHIHEIKGLFSNLYILSELTLSTNNIPNVPREAFVNSSSLTVLFLNKNAIRHLNVDAFVTLSNLIYLDLGSNFITEVPEYLFLNNKKLATLCLDNNHIKYISPNIFNSLNTLLEIRLQFNEIEALDENVFLESPNLQHLHLHNNKIEFINENTFRHMEKLSHINLCYNRLPYIDGLLTVNVSSLITIQLSFNVINHIDRYSFFGQTGVQIRLDKLPTSNSIVNEDNIIERVELNNNNILYIEDVSFIYFRTTKYLDLSNNQLHSITNLTFAGLIELEELNLSQNNISSILPKSFNILKRLRNLDLSNNNIKILKSQLFQQSLPLRFINLQNCSIHKIEKSSFDGLNNLNTLLLGYNKLSPDEVAKLIVPGLRTLKLSGNYLGKVNGEILQGLPSLHNLDLDNCQIYELSKNVFRENDKLLTINLNCNRLTSLNPDIFKNNSLLREVKLNNNQLFDIPLIAINNLINLQCLYLSGNRISSVDMSSLSIFSKLNHLTLKENIIESVEMSDDMIPRDIYSLDLSDNIIEELPIFFQKMLKNIRSLDLSSNIIKNIFPMSMKLHTPHMQFFNLSSNPIQLSGFEHFEPYQEHTNQKIMLSLFIANSNLTKLFDNGFIMFPSIHELVLQKNRINHINARAFKGLSNLNKLDLSFNYLKNIHIYCLSDLHYLINLNLSNNFLQAIPIFSKTLKQIKILDFSYNRIDILVDEINNLEDLSEIYLQNNIISYVSNDFFMALKKIITCDLSYNDFQNVSLEVFIPIEPRLESLKLEGNPLSCGCDSLDLWNWISEHPNIKISVDIDCKYPDKFQSQYNSEMGIQELCKVKDVMKISIEIVTSNSAVLYWQVRNYTGIQGFQLAFYLDDNRFQIYTKVLPQDADFIKLINLLPNSRYIVCISALYEAVSEEMFNYTDSVYLPQYSSANDSKNYTEWSSNGTVQMFLFADSPTGHCTSVKTFNVRSSPNEKGAYPIYSGVKIILTRRLGLMVGCGMGVIVFIIMVTILGYSKTKKRRQIPSPDEQMLPEFPTFGPYQYASMTIPKVSNYQEKTVKDKSILLVKKDTEVRIKLSETPN